MKERKELWATDGTMSEGSDRVKERQEMVMACLRELMINHSLDTGNRALFDRMTGTDWERELTGGVERALPKAAREIERDLGDRWEMQLLNAFVGEVDYYYKEDVIYESDYMFD